MMILSLKRPRIFEEAAIGKFAANYRIHLGDEGSGPASQAYHASSFRFKLADIFITATESEIPKKDHRSRVDNSRNIDTCCLLQSKACLRETCRDGPHCVQERALDVSITPLISTAGSPSESFIRKSPSEATRSASGTAETNDLKARRSARFLDRWIARFTRSQSTVKPALLSSAKENADRKTENKTASTIQSDM
ncbi:mitochondrial ATP synthase D chain-related protein [Striga asiatica]|uniref:Mitochondrial ATP synthase D chain-related protein n=1 Tax=Striga asiatica TaxID=4170 RepID=A0A5A7QIM1_STRAF|nr:mitochondrial ATP synthase D chain-related protein [Striga asiatica]